MTQTRTFASLARLTIAAALLLAAVSALLIAPRSGVARAPSGCPTFQVLGNDKIGPAVLPKGTYNIKVFGNTTCSAASSHFARFLQDYDGKLPNNWVVVPGGSGKATFTHRGTRRFSVSRKGSGGGGGGHNPQLGMRCPNPFKVLHNDRIGPLKFPKGSYRFYIPPRSKVPCSNAANLFAKFLARPDGTLPNGWALNAQTAIFYKPGSSQPRRFRVDPGT